MEEAQQQTFDQYFGEIAQRSGSIEQLLHNFFGFLHRRTDFYVEVKQNQRENSSKFSMGFPEGVAESLVLKAFHQYPMKDYSQVANSLPPSQSHSSAKASIPSSSSAADNRKSDRSATAASTLEVVSAQPSIRTTVDGKQIPIGNGGIGPNYYWTQTLKDVTVYLDLPEHLSNIKSKDIQCQIKTKSIAISLHKSNEVLLAGELEEGIDAVESMWTLNKGDQRLDLPQLVITLEKRRETWWKHVIIGHPEIDTTKV